MLANVTAPEPKLLQNPYDYYLWTLTLSDSRPKGWLFIESPVPTILLTLAYLGIVWIGPKLMKNRKPFKINWLLIPYNFVMACLNFYIGIRLFFASTRLGYSYICEPSRDIRTPDELQIVDAVWWFYFSKFLEFSDTFFFILRKKDNQLSFLHIYHHSTMFPLWWIGTKWVPTGSTFFPAMANSMIHVLMYTYYGLSAFGPKFEKFLWWKKYLTIIQLIQFTVALVLGINGLFIGCEFPVWMHYVLIFYMLSFIVLFGNFYAKEYYTAYKERRKNNNNEISKVNYEEKVKYS